MKWFPSIILILLERPRQAITSLEYLIFFQPAQFQFPEDRTFDRELSNSGEEDHFQEKEHSLSVSSLKLYIRSWQAVSSFDKM